MSQSEPTLDLIKLTLAQWAKFKGIFVNREMDDDTIRFLERPALPYFRVMLQEPKSKPILTLEFAPPERFISADRYENEAMETEAKVAIHHYEAHPLVDAVIVLGLVKNPDTGKHEVFYEITRFKALPQSGFRREILRDTAFALYSWVQETLYNRPTVFRDASTGAPVVLQREKERGEYIPHQNKVKTVRVVTISSEDIVPPPKSTSSARVFNCPCWGVMGHERRCKSGKVIWIQPYLKGAERSNTSKYCSKEYDIRQEEALCAN